MIASSARRAAAAAAGGGEPEAPPPYREPPPPSSPIHTHNGSGQPSSVTTRASAGARSYPRRASRASVAQAGLNRHYSAVIEALESPPVALASLATSSTGAQGGDPLADRPRRGTPLVQWVWPSNASASVIAKAGGSSEGNNKSNSSSNVLEGGGESNRCCQDNNLAKRRVMMHGLHQRGRREAPPVVLSGVVTGKVCEPVRPTRLDLSASQGYPLSSRVIYTAKSKGRHTNNPADAPPPPRATTASAAAAAAGAAAVTAAPRTPLSLKPPALKLPLSFPLEAPWLDSAGRAGGGGGTGSGSRGRGRAYSSNSATAAGLPSPRYLQSTTVSQAKAVEPAAKKRAGSFRARRASLDGSETD
ncbi:unnamed protein product, partial [Laminaria digitata]